MLTERYSEVELELKNAIFNDCLRESIYFDSKTAALATTRHLVRIHFSGENTDCHGSDSALIDTILLQFQVWDYVGFNDRSCQEWVIQDALRYFRQAVDDLGYIFKARISDKKYIDRVKQNVIYQGLALRVLKCFTIEDLQIICRQYPKIINMIESKYNDYTSNYGRGNPLDSVLERLKDLR